MRRDRGVCERCGQDVPLRKDGSPALHTVGSGPYAPGESRPTCGPWNDPKPVRVAGVGIQIETVGLVELAGVLGDVVAERQRAHELHADNSMEARDPLDVTRLLILLEEVGEVAKEFNDARVESRPVDVVSLRKELIQVAAMSVAWADVLGER